MKPSSKRILRIAAALAILLAVFVLLRLPGPSDEDQIRAQLEAARAAGERHNVSGIMKIISADYHGNSDYDRNVDELHLFLARTIGRSGEAVQVSLSPPSVQLHGDTADTVGQVTVRPPDGGATLYDAPVTMHWKKEDGTRWLVFPAKVWRVVRAEFPAPGGGGDEGGGLM